MDPVIQGDGLVLRIWRRADRDALALILERSAQAIAAWLPGVMTDLADLDVFLLQVEIAFRDGSGFLYAIEERGQVVGQCSLHHRGAGTAEIGYWLASDRTGRGLATRAVTAVARAALEDGVRELVIHCDEGNLRSAAVARRAGFVHVSTYDLDGDLPRTPVQTGREMLWVRSIDSANSEPGSSSACTGDQSRGTGDAYEEGMRLRERRRLKAAAAAFERAVQEDPRSATAWFWLGATRDNTAQEEDAIPAYERALELGVEQPEIVKAWTWLASSYSKTGRHHDAIRAITRAQALGGYEPRPEFDGIARGVRRRSGRGAETRQVPGTEP